ncbi:MAG: OmpA family protein [Candidatus Krumholzibacteriia bacterium]
MRAFLPIPRLMAAAACAAALVLSPAQGAAADRDPDGHAGRWGLGLESGFWKLTGGERDDSTVDQFGAVSVSRGLTPAWTLQLALRYGYVRPGRGTPDGDDVGWSGSAGAPLYTPTMQPMVRLQRRFAPAATLQPFVGAGIGLSRWKVVDKTGQDAGLFPSGDAVLGYDDNGDQAILEGTDLVLGLELGVDVVLSPRWTLSVGGRLHAIPANSEDNVGLSSLWGPDHVDANTSSAEAFVGVTWWSGRGDRDRDGIPDRHDGCPDLPEDLDGFRDDDGCPDPDNDGDGIPDASDACPDEAEDHDGFQDDDGCPDPDNDGDGIVDALDACPDGAEDHDGFRDDDGCPDPDNDGDGIADDRDRCPDTPPGARVDAEGCVLAEPAPAPPVPAVTPAVLPVPGQTVVLEAITFESGSARLAALSLPRIDALAAALAASPGAQIEVRGHTDAVGDGAANLDLSQRRASAVRDALVQRGIAPGRVTAVGYGEDFPMANNATSEGRARNRRVELHRVE